MNAKQWQKPGENGWWDDPSGVRHWLYPDDQPFLRDDGVLILARVTTPNVVSLFDDVQNRAVLYSRLDRREAYRYAGWARRDGDEWVARVANPENRTGTIESGRFAEREQAVAHLLNLPMSEEP